jgi:RecB family endonuclease NucS
VHRVRLIVARCEVHYTGRLTAVLPEALRLLMLKSDGSVMVHADTGGFKPQNWGRYNWPHDTQPSIRHLPSRFARR